MPKPKLIIWRSKKEIWFLVFLLGLVALMQSPIAERAPLLFLTASQGNGTILQGYKIHTGLDYIYHHHEYLGGVSLQKVSSGFKGIYQNYYLKFEEGATAEINKISSLCERPISTCEIISFDNYIGVNLGTYIEVNDEIINLTIYYNPDCNVYIKHHGNPFDQIYIDVVKRFFNDNCPGENS